MSFPGLDLTGRTAVVIGATSGIGKAIASASLTPARRGPTGRREKLAAEAAREVEARGRRSLAIAADVSDTARFRSSPIRSLRSSARSTFW